MKKKDLKEAACLTGRTKYATCQKALRGLDDSKIEYEFRDIKEDNPSFGELSAWYKMSGLPLKKFFNTSGLWN